MKNLSQDQLFSAAVQKASKSLGELFGEVMRVEAIDVTEGRISDVVKQSYEWCDQVVGAVFNLNRPKGHFLFWMPTEDAKAVAGYLAGQRGQEEISWEDERAKSILTEVGNIFVGSFLGVLADSKDEELWFGSPGFVYDALSAVLDGLLGDIALEGRLLRKVDIQIISKQRRTRARILLLEANTKEGVK